MLGLQWKRVPQSRSSHCKILFLYPHETCLQGHYEGSRRGTVWLPCKSFPHLWKMSSHVSSPVMAVRAM